MVFGLSQFGHFMREFRLFSSQPLTVGEVVTLDASAHRHVGTVLRLRVGAPLVLFDGDGFDYAAELVACDRRTSQVRILAREAVGNESPLDLVLFAALLKGEAMDRVVQKAVELGAKRIVPLRTARSEALPADERLERKRTHWQGIVIASAMQCGRATLPQVDAVRDFADVLADAPGLRWIFSPHDAPAASGQAAEAVSVLIGPEGGFAPHEVTAAVNAGWLPQSLGPRVLRADTAATVALARAQAVFGDLSREAVC